MITKFFIPLLSLFFLPHLASAQLVTCQNNCTFCDFLQTGDNIIRFLLEISFLLAVGVIVYGAFQMMISAGSPAKYESGRKAVTIALSGVLIVLVSWVFVHQMLTLLAGQNLFQGNFSDWVWNEIPCSTNYDDTPLFSGGGSNGGGASGSWGDDTNPFPNQDCSDLHTLAAKNNVPYPARNSSEINEIVGCITHQLELSGKGNWIDTSQIYTYERSNDACNYTRGVATCGSCQHSTYSCHYGGRTSTAGSLAVDFNANLAVTSEINLYNSIQAIAVSGACLSLGLKPTIIFETDHTHISAPSCRDGSGD